MHPGIQNSNKQFLLGIVIPLKAAAAARDWNSTQECLAHTLQTLEAQSDARWSAVICGHDKPAFAVDSPNVQFVESEFPMPQLKPGGSYLNNDDFPRILDKYRKVAQGIRHLSAQKPSHWFVLDADDLLHRDFVARIAEISPASGCVLRGGFVYFSRARRIQRVSCLDSICGSTTVIAAELVRVPDRPYDNEVAKGIPWCTVSHSEMEDLLSARAMPAILMEPLVCYVMGHGDNSSDGFRAGSLCKIIRSRVKPYILGGKPNSREIFDFSLLRSSNVLE